MEVIKMPGPDYLYFKSYMENQRSELYHHGILGQKWGKRNGPPYPLNPSQKSSVEKKRETDNKRYSGEYMIKNYKSPAMEKTKAEIKAFATGFLSSFVPGGFLLLTAVDLKNMHKYYGDRKDYSKKEGQYEKISQLKKKDVKTTSEQDVKLTNPRIGQQKGKNQ